MAVGTIARISYDVITTIIYYVFCFMAWFWTEFLPFVIQYIALPLFVLGVIMAIAFAGGTVLFTIIFFIVMYYFIKETIFTSDPFGSYI